MPAENVLLLPGMLCDARLWSAQARKLEQPVYYADTTSADNFTDMATAVLRDAPPTFAMAGLSLGGILAFEIWRQAPQRVTHMALLDTNPHAEKAPRKSRRLEEIGQAAAGGLRELATEQLKPLYLAESHRDDQVLLDTLLDMAMDLGPDVFRSQSLALRDRVDSAPILPGINCPVLVACGAEDKLCPVEYHTFMAEEIPNATLSIINDCGHISTLEQPDIVTELLLDLIQQ